MTFRLGTRGSALALAQAEEITGVLRDAGLDEEIRLVTVRTSGDRGGKGMRPKEGSFAADINALVLNGELDGGIHSMKDLPVNLPQGLELPVIPARGRRGDCLVSREYYTRLPAGSGVGSSSARRIAQLLRERGDLEPVMLRGNVTTRLGKVEKGKPEAAVLALCGLDRIGYRGSSGLHLHPLPVEKFVPAACQGALALVTASGRLPAKVAERADHGATRREVEMEREVLSQLGAGCNSPLGVSALSLGRGVHIRIQLLSPDGSIEKKVSAVVAGKEGIGGVLQPFTDEVYRSIIEGRWTGKEEGQPER